MSTADIAVIVLGGVAFAEIGERAWFRHRLADRLRLGSSQNGTAPAAGKAGPSIPAGAAGERQQQYNALRGEGKDPDAAAAELGIVAGTTRRDYERRWKAAA